MSQRLQNSLLTMSQYGLLWFGSCLMSILAVVATLTHIDFLILTVSDSLLSFKMV